MSNKLYWRRVMTPRGTLNDELLFALRKRFGNPMLEPTRLDSGDVPYLKGLEHGGVPGVAALLRWIQKDGVIEIWEDI